MWMDVSCRHLTIIPSLNNKILDWSKFKAFADDKCNLENKKIYSFWDCLKRLREKKKMLVTSIFSFSHNVSKKLLLQDCVEMGYTDWDQAPDTQSMYNIKCTSPIMYAWLHVCTYAEGHSVKSFGLLKKNYWNGLNNNARDSLTNRPT